MSELTDKEQELLDTIADTKSRAEEYEERLRLAYGMIEDVLSIHKNSITIPVAEEMTEIARYCNTEESFEEIKKDEEYRKMIEEDNVIIISCDASITENPGGQCSVGYVIRFPPVMNAEPIKQSMKTPSNSNNEGEYDAIYEALKTLFALHNHPPCEVEIHSDSKLVVKQLNGEWKINNPELQRRCTSIHELCSELPVPVSIAWHRRNSTEDLAEANFLAQDEIGVKRH